MLVYEAYEPKGRPYWDVYLADGSMFSGTVVSWFRRDGQPGAEAHWFVEVR